MHKYTAGKIELEIEITHHEPFIEATRDDPGFGGDIDYDIVFASQDADYVPDGREDGLILEFLAVELEREADQAREDFELRDI